MASNIWITEVMSFWVFIVIVKDAIGISMNELRTISWDAFTGLSSKEIMDVLVNYDMDEGPTPLPLKLPSTHGILPYWEPPKTNYNNYRRSNNKIEGKIEPINDNKKHGPKQKSNEEEKNIKEKPMEKRRNSRVRPIGRSTRMIQMGLKQDKPKPIVEETKSQVDTPQDYKSRVAGPLNVYALLPQINQLLENFPNANVSHEILGRTASYNDIILFKISERNKEPSAYFRADIKYVDEAPEKKIIFIVHALSAMGITQLYSLTREKYLETLLSYYLKHLDQFDIFLVPMANPDGYMKNNAKTSSGIPWNKNLSPQAGCAGVDLDRNFDVTWNSSRDLNSCSQHYPGPMPFSEPESRAIRDVLHRFSHKIIAYFHVHAGSYNMNTFKGDAVLYPRGFTDIPSDDDKYLDIKGEIDEALKNASFKVITVTVDTLHNWYGRVYGTSVDYASTIYGIPYAMELVMQIYMSSEVVLRNSLIQDNAQDTEYYALTEIWQRVIDIIFNNIAKNAANNDT